MATNAVAVKLPEFWEAQADVWFVQAEAQFQLRGITADETRYYHVVAALGPGTAARVVSILRRPPGDHKYEALKRLLLATFGLTEIEWADRLLDLPALGDTRPSVRMEFMLSLLGDQRPDFLFCALFLRQLPAQVRLALAGSKLRKPRALAGEADKYFAACDTRSMYGAAVVAPGVEAPAPPASLVAAATPRPLLPPPPPPPPPTRPPWGPPPQTWCYYHARFGRKAKTCRPPCSFDRSGNDRRSLAARSVDHSGSLLFIMDTLVRAPFSLRHRSAGKRPPRLHVQQASRGLGPRFACRQRYTHPHIQEALRLTVVQRAALSMVDYTSTL
uniref:uncharacterized protein n=1 Tax=Myxine glutinosa TaxID=7769 RepID=UPI00358E34FA